MFWPFTTVSGQRSSSASCAPVIRQGAGYEFLPILAFVCPARGVSPSSFLPKQSGTMSGHCGHVQAPVSWLSRICCSSVRLIGVRILPVVEIKRIHSGVVTPAWGVGKVPGTRTHYPKASVRRIGEPPLSGPSADPHRTSNTQVGQRSSLLPVQVRCV